MINPFAIVRATVQNKCLDRLICAGFCRRRVEYHLNGLAVCCTSSGRYVAIECKATDQDRFKRSEVSQVQAAHLDAVPMSFLALHS